MIEDRFIIERALCALRDDLEHNLDCYEHFRWEECIQSRGYRSELARINAELARRMNPIAHRAADHRHSPIAPLEDRP